MSNIENNKAKYYTCFDIVENRMIFEAIKAEDLAEWLGIKKSSLYENIGHKRITKKRYKIEHADCLPDYVYVKVTRDKYENIEFIADSIRELSEMTGVKMQTILMSMQRGGMYKKIKIS